MRKSDKYNNKNMQIFIDKILINYICKSESELIKPVANILTDKATQQILAFSIDKTNT